MITDKREKFRPYTKPEDFARIIERESVSEMWESCVKEFADIAAIQDNETSHTYSELEDDAAKFRTLLLEKTDDEHKRVAILAQNSYDFVKAFIAVTTLGLTAVIMPAHLDKTAVFGCCMKFGISAVVYQGSLEESVSLAKDKLGHIGFIEITETSDVPSPMVKCEAKTPCVMMFTGGTTGKSKCAMLSNGAVMQGTVNGCYGVHDVFNQRYLLVLPLSHVFGLIRNLMTSLYTGSTLFICKNNKDMFRDTAVFKPTIMVMVPALAEMALTLSKQFGKNMLGDDMKTIIAGAAAVPPYLVQEYDKLGIKLLPGYGLTESANLVSGNPESLKYPDSVGYPFPNQELKIVDGELWLKGKNMMDGYIGEDEEDVYEDGWFKTGDLVKIDENGLLYITGRIKEIIVLPSGENVSPAELENKFNALPFIQDSQVFEDIDDGGKHILALEVVPRKTVTAKMNLENEKEFIISELQKVNETLPAFERVNRIEVRDSDFDRTPSMKIARYKKC